MDEFGTALMLPLGKVDGGSQTTDAGLPDVSRAANLPGLLWTATSGSPVGYESLASQTDQVSGYDPWKRFAVKRPSPGTYAGGAYCVRPPWPRQPSTATLLLALDGRHTGAASQGGC